MRPRQKLEDNPERKCAVCGVLHRRKHAWCTDCMGDWSSGERPTVRTHKAERLGKPPPPPPGFNERDLDAGKPLM